MIKMDDELGKCKSPVGEFYNKLGMWCLGTVTDNDCGPDTMCQMLDLPQTFAERVALREELSQSLSAITATIKHMSMNHVHVLRRSRTTLLLR